MSLLARKALKDQSSSFFYRPVEVSDVSGLTDPRSCIHSGISQCFLVVISPRKCDIWVSSRATSCALVSMVSHARFRFCLGNNPFLREKFRALVEVAVVGCGSWWNWKWSKSLSASVTAMYEPSPDSRSVSSCSSGSNTDELPATQRESFKHVRRRWGPVRLGRQVFLSGTRRLSEWVSEWVREREARQIDKTGVCLIVIKTSKRFAFTASAFRLVSGDFQSSGKGRSYKNW